MVVLYFVVAFVCSALSLVLRRERILGTLGLTVTLVASLIRENLLDDLSLLVHPVIVGSGRHLFEGKDGRIGLRRHGRRVALERGGVDVPEVEAEPCRGQTRHAEPCTSSTEPSYSAPDRCEQAPMNTSTRAPFRIWAMS